MMKHAVLINNSYVENLSVRYLSAYLKHKGFRVSIIHYEGRKDDVFNLLPEESLKLLSEYCHDCNLVGISLLTTHQLKRSIQINNYLKGKIKAKIIWGGVPVICDPHFYLQYADYICVGEGETVMADFLSGKEPADIKGLGYKSKDERFIINSIPNFLDLNKIPIPFLDMENGFILRGRKMIPLKNELAPSLSSYSIFSVRGCPYSCSYCLNSKLKKVFSNKGSFIRLIKVSRVIKELEWAKENFVNLKQVIFDDDDFFIRPESELKNLLNAYTARIDLPVYYIQTNIRHITDSKVRLITESGIELKWLKIGLQSASERINKDVFNRNFDKNIFFQGLKMLASRGVRVMLDVISDNPYETFSDKYESLLFYHGLIKEIRNSSTRDIPIKIYDHKLMFYPGANLYAKAEKDGVIGNNYVSHVLSKRNTLRKQKEDIDNDAFIVALFNKAIRKGRIPLIAYGLLKILRVKLIFSLMIRLNIWKNYSAFSKTKAAEKLLKNIRV